MFSLEGKRCLITGSTGGIGLAVAKAMLDAGAAEVLINGRSAETVERVVAELNEERKGKDGRAVAATADVSTAEGRKGKDGRAVAATTDMSTAEGVAALQATVGDAALDVLVCNVGIFGVRDFFEVTDSEWQRYFDVNVMSTIRCCRAFLKSMLERGEGRVIVVSSEAGVRGFATMPQYAMTKTAQIGLVRSLSALTTGTKVTVNCVLPGPTWTEGVEQYMKEVAAEKGSSLDEACAAYFKDNEPTSLIQRFLKVEEVAAQIVYLATDVALGTNGAAVRVDGGIIRSL